MNPKEGVLPSVVDCVEVVGVIASPFEKKGLKYITTTHRKHETNSISVQNDIHSLKKRKVNKEKRTLMICFDLNPWNVIYFTARIKSENGFLTRCS